ncbi:hypothetical protein ACN28S_59220 [Cystobacter fuscus]
MEIINTRHPGAASRDIRLVQRAGEGVGERYDDNFRLWYNDNADHRGPRASSPH